MNIGEDVCPYSRNPVLEMGRGSMVTTLTTMEESLIGRVVQSLVER